MSGFISLNFYGFHDGGLVNNFVEYFHTKNKSTAQLFSLLDCNENKLIEMACPDHDTAKFVENIWTWIDEMLVRETVATTFNCTYRWWMRFDFVASRKPFCWAQAWRCLNCMHFRIRSNQWKFHQISNVFFCVIIYFDDSIELLQPHDVSSFSDTI